MAFIVAEIGVNFKDIPEAGMMIWFAKQAGADAVKFQVYNKENLHKVFPSGDVLKNPKSEELVKIMLDKDKLQCLKTVADDIGIEFFATPMFIEAVDWLYEIGVKRYKIRYADRNNKGLINKALSTGKQVIISSDFQNKDNGVLSSNDSICLMYCIPEYPPESVNMPQVFGVCEGYSKPHTSETTAGIFRARYPEFFEGYSNHYPSITVPFVAAARGAKIIEVHVKQEGTKPIDDAVSITFEELEELVKLVREMEEIDDAVSIASQKLDEITRSVREMEEAIQWAQF